MLLTRIRVYVRAYDKKLYQSIHTKIRTEDVKRNSLLHLGIGEQCAEQVSLGVISSEYLRLYKPDPYLDNECVVTCVYNSIIPSRYDVGIAKHRTHEAYKTIFYENLGWHYKLDADRTYEESDHFGEDITNIHRWRYRLSFFARKYYEYYLKNPEGEYSLDCLYLSNLLLLFLEYRDRKLGVILDYEIT